MHRADKLPAQGQSVTEGALMKSFLSHFDKPESGSESTGMEYLWQWENIFLPLFHVYL